VHIDQRRCTLYHSVLLHIDQRRRNNGQNASSRQIAQDAAQEEDRRRQARYNARLRLVRFYRMQSSHAKWRGVQALCTLTQTVSADLPTVHRWLISAPIAQAGAVEGRDFPDEQAGARIWQDWLNA
jgi:hypothetical protein